MNVGSLFSGIGGFDLGFERAGMRTAWFCESEPFRQRVLARHWPGVPCYPDVSELRGADVESVDLLCGGFPCQDISKVGRRAGIEGARSGLWGEYARLVGELRPRYVVVENVADLLARGLGRVLGDLAALGYDAEWDCVPARAVGAPHLRDRLWLVAYPQREGLEGHGGRALRPGPVAGGGENVADSAWHVRRQSPPAGTERERARPGGQRGGATNEGRAVDDLDRRRHGAQEGQVCPGRDGLVDTSWWLAEPDVGRVADGVPDRVERLRALGDSLVPQIAEWIGKRLMEVEARRKVAAA